MKMESKRLKLSPNNFDSFDDVLIIVNKDIIKAEMTQRKKVYERTYARIVIRKTTYKLKAEQYNSFINTLKEKGFIENI